MGLPTRSIRARMVRRVYHFKEPCCSEGFEPCGRFLRFAQSSLLGVKSTLSSGIGLPTCASCQVYYLPSVSCVCGVCCVAVVEKVTPKRTSKACLFGCVPHCSKTGEGRERGGGRAAGLRCLPPPCVPFRGGEGGVHSGSSTGQTAQHRTHPPAPPPRMGAMWSTFAKSRDPR